MTASLSNANSCWATLARSFKLLRLWLTPASLAYSGLSTADHAAVLAGMSSVLSVLGMHRKKALLLKEFVQILILAMEEARRSGAAEAGVHPSTNGLKQPNTSPSISQFASLDLPQWLNLLGGELDYDYGTTEQPMGR